MHIQLINVFRYDFDSKLDLKSIDESVICSRLIVTFLMHCTTSIQEQLVRECFTNAFEYLTSSPRISTCTNLRMPATLREYTFVLCEMI